MKVGVIRPEHSSSAAATPGRGRLALRKSCLTDGDQSILKTEPQSLLVLFLEVVVSARRVVPRSHWVSGVPLWCDESGGFRGQGDPLLPGRSFPRAVCVCSGQAGTRPPPPPWGRVCVLGSLRIVLGSLFRKQATLLRARPSTPGQPAAWPLRPRSREEPEGGVAACEQEPHRAAGAAGAPAPPIPGRLGGRRRGVGT